MAGDRDEVAVAEAMDWLREQVRLGEQARPTSNEAAAAGYARELLHEMERLAAVEMLGTPERDELARLRTIERVARAGWGRAGVSPHEDEEWTPRAIPSAHSPSSAASLSPRVRKLLAGEALGVPNA